MRSELLPADVEKLPFRYADDTGDHWKHESSSESGPSSDPAPRCPPCLENERACPVPLRCPPEHGVLPPQIAAMADAGSVIDLTSRVIGGGVEAVKEPVQKMLPKRKVPDGTAMPVFALRAGLVETAPTLDRSHVLSQKKADRTREPEP